MKFITLELQGAYSRYGVPTYFRFCREESVNVYTEIYGICEADT